MLDTSPRIDSPCVRSVSLHAQRVDIEPGIVNFEYTGIALSLSLSDQPCKRMGIGGDRLAHQPLVAQQSYILPPSASGVCEFSQEHQAVVVELCPQILAEVGLVAGQDFAPAFNLVDPLLRQLALASVDLNAATPVLYRESLSRALAAHVVQIVQPGALCDAALKIDDRRLQRAVEFIDARLQNDLSLHDMAAAAAMSPYHFSRMFKKATGRSPLQYVIAERLQRAETLLRTTIEPVASVAWQVGYADSVRFARHFRRHAGTSPSQYRAASRH